MTMIQKEGCNSMGRKGKKKGTSKCIGKDDG
jgi:hypothetical protein